MSIESTICFLIHKSSIAPDQIKASRDFLFITSFQHKSINSSKFSNFLHKFFLASIILSIGQSQIHFKAFNQNLMFLSFI